MLTSLLFILITYVDLLSDFQFIQLVAKPSCVTECLAILTDHLLVTPCISLLASYQTIGLNDKCQLLEIPTFSAHSAKILSFYKCDWGSVH